MDKLPKLIIDSNTFERKLLEYHDECIKSSLVEDGTFTTILMGKVPIFTSARELVWDGNGNEIFDGTPVITRDYMIWDDEFVNVHDGQKLRKRRCICANKYAFDGNKIWDLHSLTYNNIKDKSVSKYNIVDMNDQFVITTSYIYSRQSMIKGQGFA
jgi:hypothetical protein